MATIVGSGLITGGPGADVIVGSEGNDTIDGLGGNDVICALGGQDQVEGGGGEDELFGGASNDDVEGGPGADRLEEPVGDPGLDTLRGRGGNDLLDGGAADDELFGGKGDDGIDGAARDDELFGEEGDDTLLGGTGQDLVAGGEGKDSASGSEDRDEVLGGRGKDFLSGNAGDDDLHGDAGPDIMLGGGGDDGLAGGAGPDSMSAGAGTDFCLGGPAGDVCNGGPPGHPKKNTPTDPDTCDKTVELKKSCRKGGAPRGYSGSFSGSSQDIEITRTWSGTANFERNQDAGCEEAERACYDLVSGTLTWEASTTPGNPTGCTWRAGPTSTTLVAGEGQISIQLPDDRPAPRYSGSIAPSRPDSDSARVDGTATCPDEDPVIIPFINFDCCWFTGSNTGSDQEALDGGRRLAGTHTSTTSEGTVTYRWDFASP